MDNLKKSLIKVFSFFFITTLLIGCSKVQYLVEQGIGQASLFLKAKENDELLKDPLTSQVVKKKIKKIEDYKDYFYKFFKREVKGIMKNDSFR